jgi:hypothetical protein
MYRNASDFHIHFVSSYFAEHVYKFKQFLVEILVFQLLDPIFCK